MAVSGFYAIGVLMPPKCNDPTHPVVVSAEVSCIPGGKAYIE